MNVFIFSGNIGKDCEVRYTANQKAIASFSVASKAGYGDNEKTTWITCKLLGKRAEGRLPEYLKKGTKVTVQGEFTLAEWEKDGVKHSRPEVVVRDIEFMSKGSSNESQPAQQSQPMPDDFEGSDIPF